MEQTFGYDLSRTCDEIRPGYRHVETCQQTVPEAILSHKRPRRHASHAGVLFVILLQNPCTFSAERRKCGNRLI